MRFRLMLLAFMLGAQALCAQALRDVRTVVILGVDGLGANVLRDNMPPHFREFQQRGAYSLHARGVMPTVTFPNFASMLSGAGPEQHGVTSNDWRPDNFAIAPVCRGAGGHFPTIFGLLREQKPKSALAMFFDGDGFPFIVEPGVPDKIGMGKGADATFAMAMEYLTSAKPTLMFLHLDLMDHAGHTEGWESEAYARALTHCDELLGQLMDDLRAAGMLPSTIVFISSDHGGVGKKHGGSTMTELEIPWMVRGPGIAQAREIAAPIDTFDTASTIAHVYGLKQPACWIGKPVVEAFRKSTSARD